MEYIYLGYEKFDAATNMALDEIALKKAASEKKAFIRFYEFEKPSLILSYTESVNDISQDALNSDDFDVTRRLSHGSVILCDDGVLAYSIACPISTKDTVKGPTSAHDYFSRRIALVLKEIGIENVSIGEHYSVRIDGRTVAGHGQRTNKWESLLYHGVLAVEPWNLDVIDNAIKLRPAPENGKKSEYQLISELPALRHHIDIDKKALAYKILKKITNSKYKISSTQPMMEEAKKLVDDKYGNHKWLHEAHIDGKPPTIKSDLGFCFIDMICPESKFEVI